MFDGHTVMESGRCKECGARETDGLSCYEMFGFPLGWEHNDPELYALQFWLVSCYMIQHPSNFTEEGYSNLLDLFTDTYDKGWDAPQILRRNREVIKSAGKIANPVPCEERKRAQRHWPMTIEDIYLGGEENAIRNISEWKELIRKELRQRI